MAIITKVSVTAELVKNLICLNSRLVPNPKITPIATETTANAMNYPKISSGVDAENDVDCSTPTMLKSTIETMSFITPSPKMQE